MKTQFSQLFQTSLLSVGYFVPIALFIFLVLRKWGKQTLAEDRKSEEQAYEEKYAEIQEQIRTFYVCRENKKLIYSLIYDLEALPYKDEEKTYVLWQNAWERFKPIEKEEVIENMIEELETVR